MMWILTFKRNSSLCKAGVFCFSEAEQSGGKERIVDEILHVVALTLLFGLSTHLICHILPAEEQMNKYKCKCQAIF